MDLLFLPAVLLLIVHLLSAAAPQMVSLIGKVTRRGDAVLRGQWFMNPHLYQQLACGTDLEDSFIVLTGRYFVGLEYCFTSYNIIHAAIFPVRELTDLAT